MNQDTPDDIPSEEAIAAARDALDAFNRETAAGGEPSYPQWAADVLKRVPGSRNSSVI